MLYYATEDNKQNMTKQERLSEDKRRRQLKLPTLDYELMTKIKGTDVSAAKVAKRQLWDKYQDSVCKRWQDFSHHIVDKKIASFYDKDEYWQNAAEAFEKAVATVDLSPDRKNRKGEVSVVNKDKFLFYIVFNGYLMSMNRDLAARLYKEHNVVSVEAATSKDDSGGANAFDADISAAAGIVSAETSYFRSEARRIINRVRSSKTIEGSILEKLSEGMTETAIRKSLNLKKAQYQVAFDSMKRQLIKQLPKDMSMQELMQSL